MLKRGIFPEIDEDTYHGDPAPQPSLNQSTAKILLERSPRHAFHQHPRLNQNFRREHSKVFDKGNVAHRLLTGSGPEIVQVDAPDWRTKIAQAQRDAIHAAGGVPILVHHYEAAIEMRDAALTQLRDAGIDWKPETHPGVLSECAYLWDDAGTWFRTKIDRVQEMTSFDIKTTGMPATERAISNKMIEDGWDVQAAFHEAALADLDPANAGRYRFAFIVQENFPPYALVVCEMSEASMTLGRQKMAIAIGIWRTCLERNWWPSYAAGLPTRLDPPSWALQQQEMRVSTPEAAE